VPERSKDGPTTGRTSECGQIGFVFAQAALRCASGRIWTRLDIHDIAALALFGQNADGFGDEIEAILTRWLQSVARTRAPIRRSRCAVAAIGARHSVGNQ